MTEPGQIFGEFQVGEVIDGTYQVVDYIGRGAMGHVYHVRHNMLNADYALKTLSKDKVTELAWRRFQNEAHAIAVLNHPNLVSLYNLGLHQRILPYYVMDLLQGRDLSDRLHHEGPLDKVEAAKIFVEVCAGISYAHKKGIIHRDIKPGNIFLLAKPGATGEIVKVVDFGIAKLAATKDPINQSLTSIGDVVGTPLYMSPEQTMGERVDARSDIYSLGCTLFEALTGSVPFRARNPTETMIMHQSAVPPLLAEAGGGREFPRSLETIIATTLAKQPEERYQSMEQMAAALNTYLGTIRPLNLTTQQSSLSPALAGPAQSAVGQKPLHRSGESSDSTTGTIAHQRNKKVLLLLAMLTALTGASAAGLAYWQTQIRKVRPQEVALDRELKSIAQPKMDEQIKDSKKAVEIFDESGGSEKEIAIPSYQIPSPSLDLKEPFSKIEKIDGSEWRVFHFPTDVTIGELSIEKNGVGLLYYKASGYLQFPRWQYLTYTPASIVGRKPDCLKRFQSGDIYAVRINHMGDSDKVFKATSNIRGVQKLDFAESLHLTEESLETLRQFHHIKVFVGANGTNGDALAQVDGWEDLEQLYLHQTSKISKFLKKIAPGRHLTHLATGRSGMELEDYKNVAALKKLEYLDVSDNKLSPQSLKVLSSLPKLQELVAKNCGITLNDRDVLKQFKTIKILNINTASWPSQNLKVLQQALPGVKII